MSIQSVSQLLCYDQLAADSPVCSPTDRKKLGMFTAASWEGTGTYGADMMCIPLHCSVRLCGAVLQCMTLC